VGKCSLWELAQNRVAQIIDPPVLKRQVAEILGFGPEIMLRGGDALSGGAGLAIHDTRRNASQLTVQWAHISNDVPYFASSDTKKKLLSKLHFWRTVKDHILEHGALLPVKIFKHGTQSFYSKTKGGVDGAFRARALLRASTTHMKWEQKIVCHIWKTLVINAFIAWRIAERSDLLQSASSFETLDKFRHKINNVQPQGDFVSDIARKLLTYADTVAGLEEAQIRHVGATALTELEKIRLLDLAKNTKRRRLSFFNTQDGNGLRLDVPLRE
jgi:hypothetical protein